MKKSPVDPRSGDHVAVLTWLAENPVPPGGTPELKSWQRRATRLGRDAIPALLHALEFAPVDIQYGAQMALRLNGVAAWLHGYGAGAFYTVKAPGKPERRITPLLTDVLPPLDDDEGGNSARTGEAPAAYGDDLFEQIVAAGNAIGERRAQMAALAKVRSKAVRALLESGVPRSEIARKLGVQPNYVNQLAKGAGRPVKS